MPARSCWCSRRTFAASVFLLCTIITIYACFTFIRIVLPLRRASYLELDYQQQFRFDEYDAVTQEAVASVFNKTYTPRRRVQPLVQDVPQLYYWSPEWRYNDLLALNYDGTGDWMGQEFWIYLGGTAEDEQGALDNETVEPDPTVFRHRYRKHSCVDSKYICDMYNEAFDRIAQRWHGVKDPKASADGIPRARLRFADCDLSPIFCENGPFGMNFNSVGLIHMKIGTECEDSMHIRRFSVTWRFLTLPISGVPWTRHIRIPLDAGGSTIVPAFPDAEEQMWSLITHVGAEEGLEYGYDKGNVLVTTEPVPGEGPRYSEYLGINTWGALISGWDNPYGKPEWPYEFEIKCYAQYYTDEFLRWWDGPPEVAWPFLCDEMIKERRRKRAVWDGIVAENEE